MELEGKHKIELNIVGDGRIFLNYWDWAHGNDVVCEFRDGKLLKCLPDDDSEQEISFAEFVESVKDSIGKINLK